jgi:hypothetical protein
MEKSRNNLSNNNPNYGTFPTPVQQTGLVNLTALLVLILVGYSTLEPSDSLSVTLFGIGILNHSVTTIKTHDGIFILMGVQTFYRDR